MIGSKFNNPPQHDEAEVSIFGPGYGESVLVHLGQQEWIIVDSCIDPTTKQPPPLEYLRSIGVNLSTAVKLVVATHWHDDHVRGLESVFRECEAAQFVCSDALRCDEFLTLIEAFATRSMMTSSGMQEFSGTLDILQERGKNIGRRKSIGPVWALSDRLLWRRSSSDRLPCTVYALSPSDTAITLARHALAGLLPDEYAPKNRVGSRPPNHTAVVLWIVVGEATILLGSDLEETRHPGTGWSAILDSNTRPVGEACVFKIPHHGSENADQHRVWSELLQANSTALLTPFIRGATVLPTKQGVRLICSRASEAYATATTEARKSRQRPRAVEKTIRETVVNIKEMQKPSGQVRLRRNAFEDAPGTKWEVELFGTALPLAQMY